MYYYSITFRGVFHIELWNRFNDYQDKRLESWLKGRELESLYYYSKGTIREGE